MNARQFSERLGNIDDRYIQSAQKTLGYGAASSAFHLRRQRKMRRILVLAAVLCVLLSLTAAAFAANWFGLRDLLLPEKQEVMLPIDPETWGPEKTERETYMADVISLAGYGSTPENLATAEWQAFLAGYDTDGSILDSLGNSIFAPGSHYQYYQVYTQEMADKLEEIAAKYGLKLHTGMLDDLYTDEALCDQVGGDFLWENRAYSAYMYEDGTFKFDGELELEGYGHLDYQFQRCVRGSLTDMSLNIGDINDYTEWSYTTQSGVPVTLALAPHKALILVDLPDSFVTVNVLAGTETAEDDTFSSGPLSAEDLEGFADSFDFTLLTPVRPADPSLPRPTLAEVLGQPTEEDFYFLTGIPEKDAQKFYADFLALVEADDRRAVAERLSYPVCVTTEQGEIIIEDAEGFLPYYDDIFTDSLWESVCTTRYDMERADLIPNDGMIGAANGCIWFIRPQDGDFCILTIQNAEGCSVRRVVSENPASGQRYSTRNEAYAAVLEQMLYENRLPDGTECDPFEPLDVNEFALYDVNGDGAEELVLLFRNTYTAGQSGWVLAWDEYRGGVLRVELVEFPMLTFYDNGVVKAGWSYNQGRAGDALWPYTLYYYDAAAQEYVQAARVDAWDRSLAETYMEQPFPEEADRSGTGVVYYVMPADAYDLSSPMDVTDYHRWLDTQIGGAEELALPLQKLTEENVRLLRENP